MSENLIDFLKNIRVSQNEVNNVYVYYNESGKIVKVSNRKEEPPEKCKVLETEKEQVSQIQQGIKRIEDFIVKYDSETKQLQVQEVINENKILTVQDRLYRIPEDTVDPDILVQYKDKEWIVTYSQDSRKKDFKSRNYVLDESSNFLFFFSVTEKNDPNLLYELFSVKYHDLITNEFVKVQSQLEDVKDINDVSIYIAKYFDSYKFEILK